MTTVPRPRSQLRAAADGHDGGRAPSTSSIRSPLADILDRGHGHRRSMAEGASVDARGEPIPWITYPALEFVSALDLSDLSLFEFGCGNSTRFFAQRCRAILSVEHDRAYFDLISVSLPANARVMLRTARDDYLGALRDCGTRFDLIFIDGRWRQDAARVAVDRLAEAGWIILDNSDWFPATATVLRKAGFTQVDFSGFGPINEWSWTTSLFLSPGARLPRAEPHAPPCPIGGIEADLDADSDRSCP